MKPRRNFFGLAASIFGAISLVLTLSASAQTWNVNLSGTWSTAANWTPAAVPDGAEAIANITFNIDTATRVVTLDSARTIGVLNIGDSNNTTAYGLSGTAVLTMNNGANPASITAVAGSVAQTIAVPISVVSPTLNIVNNAATTTGTARGLTLSGAISGGSAGAKQIAVSGSIASSPVTLSGIISDGGGDRTISLSKSGTNNLTLTGVNTFTGGVTQGGGNLYINNNSALGTGSLTLTGGNIGSTSGNAITLSGNNAQSWSGDFGFAGTQNVTMGTGAVTLTGNRSVALVGSGTTAVPVWTINGAIGDGGSGYSLTTTGVSGTPVIVRLSGANTYTGGTNVNGGIVRFISAAALPTTGTLSIGTNGAVSVSGVYTTIGGWLGDARLSSASSGALALQGTASSENFNAITSGFNTLSIGADSGFTVVYTGTLTPGTAGYFAGGGGGSIEFSNADAFSGANTLTIGNGGGGKVILSSANSYTRETTVSAGATLDIRSSGALGTGAAGTTVAAGGGLELRNGVVINETLAISGTNSNASVTNNNAGLLSAAGANEWSGAISVNTTFDNARFNAATGASLLVSGAVTTTGANALVLTGAGTGEVSGIISGSSAIIQNGGSTWKMSGVNTFTGGMRIDNGTVSVSSIAQNLGNNTSSISLGEGTGTGRLLYTGTGETTARGIVLRSDTTGGGIIEQAGTGALVISGAVTGSSSTTGPKLLTLQGSTAGTGELTGTIADTAGTAKTNLLKTGSGTWTVSGAAKTYEGTTSVTGGVLNVSSALTNSSALSVSTGTFVYGAGNLIADSSSVTLGAGGIVRMAGFSDSFGALTLSAGAAVLDLSGGNSIATFALSTGSTWTGTLSVTGWSGLAAGGGTEQLNFTGGLTGSQTGAITFVNPDGFAAGTYSSKFVGSELVPDVLIPEPSIALLGLSGGLLLIRRRR